MSTCTSCKRHHWQACAHSHKKAVLYGHTQQLLSIISLSAACATSITSGMLLCGRLCRAAICSCADSVQRLCCAGHTDNMSMQKLCIFMPCIPHQEGSNKSVHACQSCQPVSASCIEAGPGRWVPSGCPAVLPWQSLQPAFLCSASPNMQLPADLHATCNISNCTHALIRTCKCSQVGITPTCTKRASLKSWQTLEGLCMHHASLVQKCANARSHHRNKVSQTLSIY